MGDLGVVGKTTLKLSLKNWGVTIRAYVGVEVQIHTFDARYTRPGRYAAVENAHYAH